MELKIGSHFCIQKPITIKGLQLDMNGKKEAFVNAKGDKLKKIQLQKAEFKWLNEATNTEETGGHYKSFKGKPIKSFPKTKSVDKYDICDKQDMDMFIENEKTYQLISHTLKEELKELGPSKAICFKYVNSGFKVHRAVAYLSPLNAIIMRCFRGDLRAVDLNENTVGDEITVDEGVSALSLDDVE